MANDSSEPLLAGSTRAPSRRALKIGAGATVRPGGKRRRVAATVRRGPSMETEVWTVRARRGSTRPDPARRCSPSASASSPRRPRV